MQIPGVHKEFYISTTLFIVIFTTIVLGGFTEPVVTFFGMRKISLSAESFSSHGGGPTAATAGSGATAVLSSSGMSRTSSRVHSRNNSRNNSRNSSRNNSREGSRNNSPPQQRPTLNPLLPPPSLLRSASNTFTRLVPRVPFSSNNLNLNPLGLKSYDSSEYELTSTIDIDDHHDHVHNSNNNNTIERSHSPELTTTIGTTASTTNTTTIFNEKYEYDTNTNTNNNINNMHPVHNKNHHIHTMDMSTINNNNDTINGTSDSTIINESKKTSKYMTYLQSFEAKYMYTLFGGPERSNNMSNNNIDDIKIEGTQYDHFNDISSRDR